jgi:hypothetical protein
MMALLVPRSGAQLPLGFLLLLFATVFLGASWLTNKLMGIDAMYEDWPADPADPIEQNVGWQQIEFGGFRGHCPMSMKFGRRCLHLKQPFPFQPMWWKGPASIPWHEVLLTKAPGEAWWAFFSAAEFTMGQGGRIIRLRGKAAKLVMARIAPQGPGSGRDPGQGPHIPPVIGPGALRPR